MNVYVKFVGHLVNIQPKKIWADTKLQGWTPGHSWLRDAFINLRFLTHVCHQLRGISTLFSLVVFENKATHYRAGVHFDTASLVGVHLDVWSQSKLRCFPARTDSQIQCVAHCRTSSATINTQTKKKTHFKVKAKNTTCLLKLDCVNSVLPVKSG